MQSLSGARQGLARINGTWRETRVPWNAVQSVVGGRSRLGPLPTIRDALRQSVPEACMVGSQCVLVGAGASQAGGPCWQRVPMAWCLVALCPGKSLKPSFLCLESLPPLRL